MLQKLSFIFHVFEQTTPLAVALMKHHIEIADLLLNAGVDVNFVDENGCTILMKHIGKGLSEEQLNLVKVLLEKFKADPTKVDARNCNTVCLCFSSIILTKNFYYNTVVYYIKCGAWYVREL